MRLSYSSVTTYADCPQRYYYAYVMKIEPKRKPRPLQFGSDFHKLTELRWDKNALQAEYKRIQDDFNALTDSQSMELGATYVEDLLTIFHDYRLLYKDDKKPQALEQPFEIKLGSYRGEPVTFVGVIDEILDDDTIGERKTFTRKVDAFFMATSTQVALYAKARSLLGHQLPTRVRWDYIHSLPSTEPAWLEKSQRFSEASSARITPFSWQRACKHRGIDDPDILAKGQTLYGGNVEDFFYRRNVEILPMAVEKHWRDFMDLVREIAAKGHKNSRQRQSMSCVWCAYKSLCHGYHTNADLDYMIKKDFQPKQEGGRFGGDEPSE